MTYSSLAFRTATGDVCRLGTIIALHGNHGDGLDLLPIAQQIAKGIRIEAPTAARGIYEFRSRSSSSWYGGADPVQPEPASFGDSLAQLEMFIHDAQQRTRADSPKPWLLGYEQGAVLALSISLIAPDLVRGVISINGGLPHFSDPNLLAPVQGLHPVLLIGDSSQESSPQSLENSALTLRTVGRQVEIRTYNDTASFPTELGEETRSWLQGHAGK